MHKLALEHATIEYQLVGAANAPQPPVLFVHGILVDHRLWSQVAEGLARRGFRCIVPTWPLGSHTIPVDDTAPLSPRGVAEMIHEFIVVLGLSDVTLVGNDTGGGLCQLVLDAHPDRIGRVVLTNCDAFDKFPPLPFNIVFSMLRGPLSITALFAPLRLLAAVRHSPLGFGLLLTDPDPTITAAWLQPCLNDSRICRDLTTLLRRVAVTDLTEVSTRLPRFSRPVRWLWGQRDRCFTPALGRRPAAVFPNSSLIEVPGAKTFVPLDRPAAVIDAITGDPTSNSRD